MKQIFVLALLGCLSSTLQASWFLFCKSENIGLTFSDSSFTGKANLSLVSPKYDWHFSGQEEVKIYYGNHDGNQMRVYGVWRESLERQLVF